jgi:hypothetical protein
MTVKIDYIREASGFFLTHPLPKNWSDMMHGEVMTHVICHPTDAYEEWSADNIWAEIVALAGEYRRLAESIITGENLFSLINWPALVDLAKELELEVACMLDSEPEVSEIEHMQEKIGEMFDLIKRESLK